MQLTLNTRKSNIGTCPHGLPLGSCPICNGMSGGGAKKADFSAKPGEMSWNECAAIGAFLRAQKLAKQQHNQDAINFAQRMADFQKNLTSMHTRLTQFNVMLTEKLPRVISTPLTFIVQTVFQRPIEIMKAIPRIIHNLADISAKITSVLGEIKTAINKKISDAFSELKKKVKSLFAIFETLNLNNEDKKIDEEKRIFDLKKFIKSLIKKEKEDETP
ncbi:MAG: hypothetical protein NC390_06660 [Fusobacterium sp.]|nr:hypothetical protein [Fusobacterium sp.]